MALLHRERVSVWDVCRLCPQCCHLGSHTCRRVVRCRAELGQRKDVAKRHRSGPGGPPSAAEGIGPSEPTSSLKVIRDESQ